MQGNFIPAGVPERSQVCSYDPSMLQGSAAHFRLPYRGKKYPKFPVKGLNLKEPAYV